MTSQIPTGFMTRVMHKFDQLPLNTLARQSRFLQRQPRKITPKVLLLSFFASILSECRSLRHLALKMAVLSQGQVTISKQAIHKRLKAPFVDMLEALLVAVMFDKANPGQPAMRLTSALPFLNRILVQDSTTVRLSPNLIEAFPGPRNQHRQHAVAKIQAVIDLASEKFHHFKLTPFTENDQSRSADILTFAQKGDLVIRDLGYHNLAVFQQMASNGVLFLSRYRYGTIVLNDSDKTTFDLLRQLKKKQSLDVSVLVGRKEQLPARLIARPVPEHIANERRRRARADRHHEANHSAHYYALLGWQIYITTIPAHNLSAQQLCQLYNLRWRIETIFKCWKSHFKLRHLPAGNPFYVKAYIYAMLIMIILFHLNVYRAWSKAEELEELSRPISLLKLASSMKSLAFVFGIVPERATEQEFITKLIFYHCRYEKRARRPYPAKLKTLS